VATYLTGCERVVLNGVHTDNVHSTSGSASGVFVSQNSTHIHLKYIVVKNTTSDQSDAHGVYVDDTSTVLPSSLATVDVSDVTGVNAHRIIIDGQVTE